MADQEKKPRAWPAFAALIAAFVAPFLLVFPFVIRWTLTHVINDPALQGLSPAQLQSEVVSRLLAKASPLHFRIVVGFLLLRSVCVICISLIGAKLSAESLPVFLRLEPRKTGRAGISIAVLGSLGLGFFYSTVLGILGGSPPNVMQSLYANLSGTTIGKFCAFVTVEEFWAVVSTAFIVGFLQSRLSAAWSRSKAIMTISLLFAISSGSWNNVPYSFALGLLLSWLTEVTQSAYPAIISMFVLNAVADIWVRFLPRPPYSAMVHSAKGLVSLVFLSAAVFLARRTDREGI
ncbi:MAG: CPBP family intramembrane metalloprotease [Elusimicrobia bacterium]|nr:CPBP family intramembrane metalloprotease [Elusimicrobiota bacterium]